MEKENKQNTENAPDEERFDPPFARTIITLLCIIMALSVVAFGAVDTWALSLLSLFGTIIGILWAIGAFKMKEFIFSSSELQIPLIGIILIGIIQLLPLSGANIPGDILPIPAIRALSYDPSATRFAIAQYFTYLIFFAAALAHINSLNRLKRLAIFIIIFGTIMAFFAIIQRLANLDEIYGVRPIGQAIPFGSFINQHHFAAFMEMTLGVTLGFISSRSFRKEQFFLFLFSAILMVICIIFTGSRGGILSLLGVAAFAGAASFAAGKREGAAAQNRFAILGGGLALIFVILGAILFLGADSSLMRGLGLASSGDLSNGRLHFWGIAWQIFLSNPIFGAGLESFGVVFTKFDSWNGSFRIEQAHNEYVQILAEAGILGFICLAAFIFFLFKKGANSISRSHDPLHRGIAIGALAGCFGILIHSFFDFPLRTPSNAVFFLVLAAMATITIRSASAK